MNWTRDSNNLFSAVKRWQHQLSALFTNALNRLAKARREKHREKLSKEAQRRDDLLELRDQLRNRLHERLKEK